MKTVKRWSILLLVPLLLTACQSKVVPDTEGPHDSITIQTGETWQIQPFTPDPDTPAAPLYAYSIPVPDEIRDKMNDRFYGSDCDNAIHIFDRTAEPHFWFPIMAQGKVVNIYFAHRQENGEVTIGHSTSEADALTTLAPLTSEETPLLIVPTEYFCYYIIGDTAWVEEDLWETWQPGETYTGDFLLPESEILVVQQRETSGNNG